MGILMKKLNRRSSSGLSIRKVNEPRLLTCPLEAMVAQPLPTSRLSNLTRHAKRKPGSRRYNGSSLDVSETRDVTFIIFRPSNVTNSGGCLPSRNGHRPWASSRLPSSRHSRDHSIAFCPFKAIATSRQTMHKWLVIIFTNLFNEIGCIIFCSSRSRTGQDTPTRLCDTTGQTLAWSTQPRSTPI